MIGNAADAAIAAEHARSGETTYLLSDDGSSRIVYLINGVVYKVNRGQYRDNEEEYANGNRWRESYALINVIIPDMTMHGDIIAMEYVDGDTTGECLSDILGLDCECENKCLSQTFLNSMVPEWIDCSYGNAVWKDETLYLIDVAC